MELLTFAIRVDADTFKLATTSSNASGGTAITITGGSGGSVEDTFASPITGLTDGETYFVVKTDDHNFKLAQTLALATNASPSTITIAGQTGGNALDTFDPGKDFIFQQVKQFQHLNFHLQLIV